MSDPNTIPEGEKPAEELNADDAVASANEGLAEAEAAGREATVEPEPVVEAVAEPAEEPAGEPAPEEPSWYDLPLEDTPGAADPEPVAHSVEPVEVAPEPVTPVVAEPVVAEPVVVSPAPVDPAPTAVTEPFVADAYVAPPVGQQPIFVQAPEAPRPRGNRGGAGGIGLVAAITFAVLFLGVIIAASFLTGTVTGSGITDLLLTTVSSWWFWTPVVAFFIGFWLLGGILNRAAWGHWVVWGLLVGVISYAGYLLGLLFQAPFWDLTASQGQQLLADNAFAPFAIVAFVLGRELTIWFGAWVARRGRRMTELNEQAQLEYEKTLEAGPQLYQQ